VPALQHALASMRLGAQAGVGALALAMSWLVLRPSLSAQPVWLLGEAAAVGAISMLMLAVWLRPWRLR